MQTQQKHEPRPTVRLGRIGRIVTVKKPGDIVLTSRGFEVVK